MATGKNLTTGSPLLHVWSSANDNEDVSSQHTVEWTLEMWRKLPLMSKWALWVSVQHSWCVLVFPKGPGSWTWVEYIDRATWRTWNRPSTWLRKTSGLRACLTQRVRDPSHLCQCLTYARVVMDFRVSHEYWPWCYAEVDLRNEKPYILTSWFIT